MKTKPYISSSSLPAEVSKFPQEIVVQVQRAIETLNYIREMKKDEGDENVKEVIEVIEGIQVILSTFRSYAARKHLDADLALAELGYTLTLDKKQSIPSINLGLMADNTKGWPSGATEHAYRLAADINLEICGFRRARLYKALGRLQKRYSSIQR